MFSASDVSTLSQKQQLLRNAVAVFKEETSLVPVIGAELEFYLTPDIPVCLDTFQSRLAVHCKEQGMAAVSFEKERGDGQYEIQIDHTKDILLVADSLEKLPAMIRTEAQQLEQEPLFSSKPFPDQPGNSLHFHIGLFHANGKSALMRHGPEAFREESSTMLQAIAGLLTTMQESLIYLAPNEEDYQRFVPKCDAPTTVSWGGNNRTCTLRIPASSWVLEPTRHIEHRLASAGADPYLAIATLLGGIHHGVTQKLTPSSPKTYGDASLPMYNLEPLASSLEQATQINREGNVINAFLARSLPATS